MDRTEEERLAALRAAGLTDAGALRGDPDLEAVAAVAQSVTGAAAAAVHVIESDRQVRVAAAGAPEDDVPREASMCSVTMWHPGADGVYLVDDARDAPELAANPFVTGELADVRFYAAAPFYSPEGLPLGTLCVWSDEVRSLDDRERATLAQLGGFVTRVLALRRRALEQEALALVDPLTGIGNRRHLEQRTTQALALAARRPDRRTPPALVFVDLDGFKQVNDGLGHAAGDAVLRAVAQRLLAEVRAGDTVARYGGDEFVVLVEDSGAVDLPLLVRRLRAVVAEEVPLEGGGTTRVTASTGVAVGELRDTAADLLGRADAAMYAARHAARTP